MKHGKCPLLVVGLAGPSACGKSVLARSIHSCFNHESVGHLDLDGYHCHARTERQKLGEYPDQSEANRLDDALEALRQIRNGYAISMPVYNHVEGTFGEVHTVEPLPLMIVEGLHALHLNELAQEKLIDLPVYVKPEEPLRREWKKTRDVEERNYESPTLVQAEIDARAPFRIQYIEPQEHMACCVVRMKRTSVGKLNVQTLFSDAFVSDQLESEKNKTLFDMLFVHRRIHLFETIYHEFSIAESDIASYFRNTDENYLQQLLPCRSHENAKAFYYNEAAGVLFRVILYLCSREGG